MASASIARTGLVSLLALVAAAGCGDDAPADGAGGAGGAGPTAASTGETTAVVTSSTGSEVGTGGAGGAGGEGGAGSAGGEPGALALELRNQSHGESWSLAAADLDGDGSDEVVLGGRGLAAFASDGFATNAPTWTVDWEGGEFAYARGDNDWAYAVETLSIDGDTIPDFVVATSFLELQARSGADGSLIWQTTLEGSFPTAIALFDAGDDDVLDLFVVGDTRGFSGATGEALWSADLPDIMILARSAELDGAPGGELYVGIEEDGIVGPAGGGGPGASVPTLVALDASGAVLFSYQAGTALTALAAVDLDGDGRDEAIAASGGAVDVVSPDGERLWGFTMAAGAHAHRVAAAVVDGEPRVLVGVLDFENGNRIEAYDPAGTLLWAQPINKDGQASILEVIEVEGRAAPMLLVGSGQTSPPSGALVAIDLADDAESRLVWRANAGLPVDTLTRATIDGAEAIVFGGWSTIVSAVDAASGASLFDYTSGSFVHHVAAGDLDGDGIAEAVSADDHGNLRCVGSDGLERWTARLSIGPAGAASSVVIADLDGDGRGEVIAGGATFATSDQRGVVDVFSGDGTHVLTLPTTGWVEDVGAADLDGDGALEIVATEAAAWCTVLAFDGGDGELLFATPVAPCFSAFLAIGDLDGEPGDEIGYADVKVLGDSNVALVLGGGELSWNHVVPELETWIDIHDGKLLVAGAAPGFQGHLTERALEDGAIVWQTLFEGRPHPDFEGETIPGAVRATGWVPDQDGDGSDDLAVGLATAELAVVGLANGQVLWKELLEDAALGTADRHVVGAIAYAPPHDGVDEALLVGMGGDDRMRSSLLSVTLAGVTTSELSTQGESHAVAIGTTAEGAPLGYFAAGLDLWGVTLSP